jgi:hypothetical protein
MQMTIFRTLFCVLFCLLLSGLCRGAENWEIVVGRDASATEHYAAAELQWYLCQLSGTLLEIKTETSADRQPAFVVGQVGTNSLLRRMVNAGQVKVSYPDPWLLSPHYPAPDE